MSLLRKIPTILGAGGGSVPEWRQHLQPCEWIMADSNSYIKTNYILKDVTYINTEYIFDSSVTIANSSVFGSTKSPYLMIKNDNSTQFGIFCNNGIAFNKSNDLQNTIYDNTGVYHNGNQILNNTLPQNNTDKLYLFCRLNNETINAAGTNIKIKQFETNFFNLLSVYVIDEYTDNKGNNCSSGVAGMVDTLTGIFYTNDGTGQFSHGADINI